MVRWALANLDLDGVEAVAAADNPASAAVLRRIGFRETGAGREMFLRARQQAAGAAVRGDAGRPVRRRRDAAPSPPALETGRSLLVAACALVDADGRVLLARRPEGSTMAGLWEFPGGKLEPGETPGSSR